MEPFLDEILRNGYLKDNQLYEYSENELKNVYRNHTIKVKFQNGYKNLPHKWNFLINTQERLRQGGKVTLFQNEEYEQNTGDSLFDVSGVKERFSLQTGNLAGRISDGKHVIDISSRFGDEFLKYIIADAEGFLEIKNLGGTREVGNLNWLLLFLWKTKLKKAFRLGLPKSYKTQTDRISKTRGNIDPVDYYLNSQSGKYLCTYREHSYQTQAATLINEVMRLKQMIPLINDIHPIVQSFKTINKGLRLTVNELRDIKPFNNPLYSDYNKVIELSKLILFNQSVGFGNDNDSNAFLFDISMLFEYFIKKLLIRDGQNVFSKLEEALKVPTGASSRELQPDILVRRTKDRISLFDVKYKQFDKIFGIKREDVFQLHTYVGQYSNKYIIDKCGFIFPTYGENEFITQKIKVMGKEIPFQIYLVGVPTGDDLKEVSKEKRSEIFAQKFKSNCEEFVKQFAK